MVLVFLLFKFNAGMEHSDAGMIKVGNNILTDFFFSDGLNQMTQGQIMFNRVDKNY